MTCAEPKDTSHFPRVHSPARWEIPWAFLWCGLQKSSNISSCSHICMVCKLQRGSLYEINLPSCIFWIFSYIFECQEWTEPPGAAAVVCTTRAVPLLRKAVCFRGTRPTGLIAWLLIILQLLVCLGGRSEGGGFSPAAREVGAALCVQLEFGVSDQHPQKRLCWDSGAAGSSCKCEWNEDMNKVGSVLYF